MKKSTAKTEAQTETQEVKEYVINGVKVDEQTPVKYIANPKRPNSRAWERYEKYQTAASFGEYLQLNEGKFSMADARHDLSKGFLKIAE